MKLGKLKTFARIVDPILRATVPGASEAIDAGKAIVHAKTDQERAAAVIAEIDADLQAAGDLSGKAALADPMLRALLHQYVQDGFALHQYIEAHKANAAALDGSSAS
jgi:hypothetical protein